MAIGPPNSNDDRHFHSGGRNHSEKEFFDVKFIATILIDVVPYERRKQMVEKLELLLNDAKVSKREISDIIENIPDMKNTGSAGVSRVATFVDLESSKEATATFSPETHRFSYGPASIELPEPFRVLEVTISQMVDFAYCITYCFILDDALAPVKKDTFVKSSDLIPHDFAKSGEPARIGSKRRGPDFNPKLATSETSAADFLLPYAAGFFLSDLRLIGSSYPSIRVLSTKKIDFENPEKLITEHYRYWGYLRLRHFFCRHRDVILTYQTEGMFTNSYVPKGPTLLYSVDDGEYDDKENVNWDIAGNAAWRSEAIIEFLVPYYWFVIHSVMIEQKWASELTTIRSELIRVDNTDDHDKMRKQMKRLLNLYEDFMAFANSELINIRKLKESFENHGKHTIAITHQYRNIREVDIFEDLAIGVTKHSTREIEAISDVREQITALLNYYRDLSNVELAASNVSLQKQIKTLTKVGAILAAGITVGLAALQIIGNYYDWWRP